MPSRLSRSTAQTPPGVRSRAQWNREIASSGIRSRQSVARPTSVRTRPSLQRPEPVGAVRELEGRVGPGRRPACRDRVRRRWPGRGRPPCPDLGPDEERPDADRPARLQPARRRDHALPGGPGSAAQVDPEDPAVDDLEIDVVPADVLVLQPAVGPRVPADQGERVRHGPRFGPAPRPRVAARGVHLERPGGPAILPEALDSETIHDVGFTSITVDPPRPNPATCPHYGGLGRGLHARSRRRKPRARPLGGRGRRSVGHVMATRSQEHKLH